MTLEELIILASKQSEKYLTVDKREFTIDLAFGNAHFDNYSLTREMVEEEYDKLVKEGEIND